MPQRKRSSTGVLNNREKEYSHYKMVDVPIKIKRKRIKEKNDDSHCGREFHDSHSLRRRETMRMIGRRIRKWYIASTRRKYFLPSTSPLLSQYNTVLR